MLITVQGTNYISHITCKNIQPTTNYGWTSTHNKYKPSRRSHTNINATSISKRNYKPNVLKDCHTLYGLLCNSPLIPIVLSLYNLVLPWVRSAIHLGHQITTDEDTSADILSSKAIFITKAHELRQELGDQNPEVFIRLVQIYLTSMYGSNLWDLYHNSAGKLFSAWNTLIKKLI